MLCYRCHRNRAVHRCAFARESINCTTWWIHDGKICKWISFLVAMLGQERASNDDPSYCVNQAERHFVEILMPNSMEMWMKHQRPAIEPMLLEMIRLCRCAAVEPAHRLKMAVALTLRSLCPPSLQLYCNLLNYVDCCLLLQVAPMVQAFQVDTTKNIWLDEYWTILTENDNFIRKIKNKVLFENSKLAQNEKQGKNSLNYSVEKRFLILNLPERFVMEELEQTPKIHDVAAPIDSLFQWANVAGKQTVHHSQLLMTIGCQMSYESTMSQNEEIDRCAIAPTIMDVLPFPSALSKT